MQSGGAHPLERCAVTICHCALMEIDPMTQTIVPMVMNSGTSLAACVNVGPPQYDWSRPLQTSASLSVWSYVDPAYDEMHLVFCETLKCGSEHHRDVPC
jgi:hypothetical protein